MSDTTLDLVLLHGRRDPNEDMDDWGFSGPTLQGVVWTHWTYGSMNVAFATPELAKEAEKQTGWNWVDDNVLEMGLLDDLVVTCGNSGHDDPEYYGDFELQGPGYRKSRGAP